MVERNKSGGLDVLDPTFAGLAGLAQRKMPDGQEEECGRCMRVESVW
jgi:hypothetical protein